LKLMGPNVKQLVAYKMSILAVPKDGGMADATRLFTVRGRLAQVAREAEEWVSAAIAVVKTAPDNPYGDDSEAIAGEILRRIAARDAKRGSRSGGL
jgi:hypothetical protein